MIKAPAYLEQVREAPVTVGLKSPFLVPLLLLIAAAFFLVEEARELQFSEPSVAPTNRVSDDVAQSN